MSLYFLVFAFSTIYIYCYSLFYNPSPFKQKYTFWRYTLLITVFLHSFLCGMYQPPLLLHLLWSGHMCRYFLSSPPPFNFNIWTLLLVVPYSLVSKISYFLYCFLSSHFYFLLHFTLHYPTHYYLKFILGNWFPLYLLFLIPVIIDQMPKPLTILTYPLSFFFQFYSQFSKGILLVKQVTHKRIISGLRHCIDTSMVQSEQLILLAILCLLEYKIFTQPESYCPTNYCFNNIVILSPQEENF